MPQKAADPHWSSLFQKINLKRFLSGNNRTGHARFPPPPA